MYAQDIADEILRRMADGESLRSICRTDGMPTREAVRLWVVENRDGFAERYALARELQAHALADELLELADSATSEDWQVKRLQVDTRKWLTSKILPKQYGDKVETEVYGKDGAPLLPPALQVVITREPGPRDDQD
jgi:hypothetical protein